MPIKLLTKIDSGGFADVWEALDSLDRRVAVKIIRPANAAISDALTHAKALARAEYNNVVSVYSIDTVQDPESGETVACVVMELLSGPTLEARLNSGPL